MQLTDQQKENIKLWLAALRSGEYKQTDGVLHNENGFCCLGVACDVYAKQTGKGDWLDRLTRDSRGFGEGFYFNDSTTGVSSLETIDSTTIKEYFGFPDVTGFKLPPFIVKGNGTTLDIALTEVNDELGLTFTEIADLVEKYILNEEAPMPKEEIAAQLEMYL